MFLRLNYLLFGNISIITFCDVILILDDTEPPVFTFCPSDISIPDATSDRMRINWQSATATDNSGEAPQIVSSRPNGDMFEVPGLYQIFYTATDGNGNVARSCSFFITLKSK